jgi:hypothetical protein
MVPQHGPPGLSGTLPGYPGNGHYEQSRNAGRDEIGRIIEASGEFPQVLKLTVVTYHGIKRIDDAVGHGTGDAEK